MKPKLEKPTRFYAFTAVNPGKEARALEARDDLMIWIPRAQIPGIIASLANSLDNPNTALLRFYDGTLEETT